MAKQTKFLMLGGFLGAGKTTSLGQLARKFTSDGLNVAIITNDQATDLVDSQTFAAGGFEVGEVAGACFCCSFDELAEVCQKLNPESNLDIILAEPVGSCTDLVATVVQPIKKMLHEQMLVLPYGVILKPSHGQKILSARLDTTRDNSASRGFSPQAAYIFEKQLEEADYLVLNRIDQLTNPQRGELRDLLTRFCPNVRIFETSAKTGEGFEELYQYLKHPDASAGARLLNIDYDTYADGEAELGWMNGTFDWISSQPIHFDELCAELLNKIRNKIVSHSAEIAHLKCSIQLPNDDAGQSIASIVSNDSPVDVGLSCNQTGNSFRMTINARVAMAPTELQECCHNVLSELAEQNSAKLTQVQLQSFRPGRPTPTHRISAADAV